MIVKKWIVGGRGDRKPIIDSWQCQLMIELLERSFLVLYDVIWSKVTGAKKGKKKGKKGGREGIDIVREVEKERHYQ